MIDRKRLIVYKYQKHKDSEHKSVKGICFSVINKLMDICEVYRTFYLCDNFSYRERYDMFSKKPIICQLPTAVIYKKSDA